MVHIRPSQPKCRKAHAFIPLLVNALLVSALLLSALTNAAEVFKWTDSAGKTHYGDKPFGKTQATRVEVTSSPDAETASPVSATTGHNGGYSDVLNSCLANGGTQTDCVARASAAQTDKAANERRMREEASRNRAQNAAYQRNSQMQQSAATGDSATALRAAELARQRREREQMDRDMRWR